MDTERRLKPHRRDKTTRRFFLKRTAAFAGGIGTAAWSRAADILSTTKKKTDVRIESISHRFEEHAFRTPLKFAGAIVNRQTMLIVDCTVRTATGEVATGFGTLPLNYVFTFPSKKLSDQARLEAMKALAEELVKVSRDYKEFGHPIEIYWALAPAFFKAAADVSQRLQVAESIPRLCTLVTAAAFDAAIHDAYGKAHRLNCFHTYGPEFMNRDLSHYLGAEYRGEYPSRYIRREPQPHMPLCHLVSAVDPIEAADNIKPIRDGLPDTLPEWIQFNGLNHLKIKLNGNDLNWDLERMLTIDRVTTETQKKRRVKNWAYIPDFNEKCPNAEYYLTFLRRVKERMPVGFKRIEYVEQPTSRDLNAHPENAMHDAAKLCPVVIDESLVDVDSLLLARRLGWTGAVVKSPKGLTQMILIACVARRQKIFLAGGDMSCPGAALIQTASLQARVPGIASVEANARQFLPAANKAWESRFPGMFRVTDGMLRTKELNRPGLGA
jgi:L-alanine-DL-glutamate epimerase-like enolase superfamily enzyme